MVDIIANKSLFLYGGMFISRGFLEEYRDLLLVHSMAHNTEQIVAIPEKSHAECILVTYMKIHMPRISRLFLLLSTFKHGSAFH